MRAVIVDDERLARRELRLMLVEIGGVEVVGEADSVRTGVAAVEEQQPDLLFLDIQLEGQTGFDLVEQIATGPRIIFVTAYDAYALRAFEVNALDYLLKPIRLERLQQAVRRVVPEASRPAVERLDLADRLMVELQGRAQFVRVGDIAFIQAAGDYSEATLRTGQRHLLLKSMKEWEERLPEAHFARIHRSTIVNLDQVESVEAPWTAGWLVKLRELPATFPVSRRYWTKLRSRFR